MNRDDISSKLGDIEPDLSKIEDKGQQAAVSILLNIVETSVAENDDLKKEVQTLKDEVNRLKGEQGKPDVKANKKSGGEDVSSDKERRDAEQTDEEKINRVGFKLNQNALLKLKEQAIPVELLVQLEAIKSRKYSNEAAFIKELESVIGMDLTTQYKDLLLKHARYKKRNRQAKLPKIKIDRVVECPVDKRQLPADAVFKDYEYKVVQDVIIKTDNVQFKREIYYSPAQKKCYTGNVPEGYNKGDFGPHINADIISHKYISGMSIPKIVEFYGNIGTLISGSYIARHLIKKETIDVFHTEKRDLHQAGMEANSYSQIDDTTTRVNGQNCYSQIVCNELYTAYFTTTHKNRLTILDVLRNFESRNYLLNETSLEFLAQMGVLKKDITLLAQYKQDKTYNEEEIQAILQTLYGTKYPRKQTKIREGCAIISYRQETGISIVKILVCDDAPQFKLLTDRLALCWIHEGRHYKRLNPVIPKYQAILADFLQQFWAYYKQLVSYKLNPDKQQADILNKAFDDLFFSNTGYQDLDQRIEKSKHKKQELLVVLDHPEVPLHNNLSENGARTEKRRQDVSLQTKTIEGTQAKDTMMSIVETCKKLGISGWEFIHDRINKINKFPSLADMIKAKAADKPTPT